MPQPKGKDWLNDYLKRPLYMLSTRDPLQNKVQKQNESEGLGKDNSHKRRSKALWREPTVEQMRQKIG